MLQIDITGSNSTTGELKLEVNGRPNNGHSEANRTDRVHWKVKPSSGVDHISAITMKNIAGSRNVFSGNPPAPQSADKKEWKGIVDGNAPDYSVYVYKIDWVPDGSSTPKIFDPIISIKPTEVNIAKLFPVLVGVLALLGISLLLSDKKKKHK